MTNPSVSVRFDPEQKELLERLADRRGESVSQIIREAVGRGLPSAGTDLLGSFAGDLRRITFSSDDHPGVYDVLIEESWGHVANEAFREQVRDPVLRTDGDVWVIGQGSSASVAAWLADRLTDESLSARAVPAGAITNRSVSAEDTIVAISHSGETDVLVNVARTHEATTTVSVTQPDTTLASVTDHVIPTPNVPERVSRYAVKTTIAQVALLQVVLLDGAPDKRTLRSRFDVLERVLDREFHRTEGRLRLKPTEQISRTVDALQEAGDLDAAPVFASLSGQRAFGSELSLKFAEFLHRLGDTIHIAAVRDRVLNVLARNRGYLVSVVPAPGSPSPTEWQEAIGAIRERLATQDGDDSVPLVAIMYSPGGMTSVVGRHSRYGRRGVIQLNLPRRTRAIRDLAGFTVVQLVTYGLLARVWNRDPDIRSHVIRSVYDDHTVSWGRL